MFPYIAYGCLCVSVIWLDYYHLVIHTLGEDSLTSTSLKENFLVLFRRKSCEENA